MTTIKIAAVCFVLFCQLVNINDFHSYLEGGRFGHDLMVVRFTISYYLCNQHLSPLTLVQILLMARWTVICSRSVVFSGFLHQ